MYRPNEEITHITSISWGMLGMSSEECTKYENEMIEKKKKEVKEALRKIGFVVTSQTFEHVIEGGTLITRAKEVQEGMVVMDLEKKEKIEFGKFYE